MRLSVYANVWISRVGPRTRVGTSKSPQTYPRMSPGNSARLAVERKTTVQNLMAEALNDLFAKYGKPEVSPLSGMAGYPDGG